MRITFDEVEFEPVLKSLHIVSFSEVCDSGKRLRQGSHVRHAIEVEEMNFAHNMIETVHEFVIR